MIDFEDAIEVIAQQSVDNMTHAKTAQEKQMANELLNHSIGLIAEIYETSYEDVEGCVYESLDMIEEGE